MKHNKNIISLLVILFGTTVWAQNTQREPIQGGATNPVTQHEAGKDPELKPLSEIVKKKKPKTKKETTAEPEKKPATENTAPATPATTVP